MLPPASIELQALGMFKALEGSFPPVGTGVGVGVGVGVEVGGGMRTIVHLIGLSVSGWQASAWLRVAAARIVDRMAARSKKANFVTAFDGLILHLISYSEFGADYSIIH